MGDTVTCWASGWTHKFTVEIGLTALTPASGDVWFHPRHFGAVRVEAQLRLQGAALAARGPPSSSDDGGNLPGSTRVSSDDRLSRGPGQGQDFNCSGRRSPESFTE